MSAPAPSPADHRPRRRPWLTWILGALFLGGLLYWWGGARAILAARSAVAGVYAKKAQEKRREKDWAAAWQNLAKARSWQVNAPQVLRAYADLLIASRSDDPSLLQVLRLLESQHLATAEERLKMGQILISLGHVGAARAEFEKLTEAEQQNLEGLELQAQLLHAEGRPDEAEKLLRQALAQAPANPDSRLRLAILDHRNSFPEVQARARQVVWEIARQTDSTGLSALDFLATQVQLNGEEAAELITLVEAHPSAPPATRYAALSARMRARPQDRAAILAAEVAAVRGQGVEVLTPALSWLLQEQQAESVLDLLSDGLHLKSGQLLQAHLAALSSLGRWSDIDALLRTQKTLPIPETYLHLWKARTAEKLDAGIQTVRHHLEAAFAQTGRGQDETAARLTAETAEQMGLWDLAHRFYAEVATQQPYRQIPLWEKVHEMALRGRDTSAALASARKLAQLQPENLVYTTRSLYLALIAGDKIETTLQAIVPLGSSSQDRTPSVSLLQALAAYRVGDIAQVREHLAGLSATQDLTAGQRAACAGMMASIGQTGPAFQLAESIPGLLLLPEEMRFLKRAL
jgi:tetratricopeptide (TPR) repeat protein